jgi:hypothetical protein
MDFFKKLYYILIYYPIHYFHHFHFKNIPLGQINYADPFFKGSLIIFLLMAYLYFVNRLSLFDILLFLFYKIRSTPHPRIPAKRILQMFL